MNDREFRDFCNMNQIDMTKKKFCAYGKLNKLQRLQYKLDKEDFEDKQYIWEELLIDRSYNEHYISMNLQKIKLKFYSEINLDKNFKYVFKLLHLI